MKKFVNTFIALTVLQFSQSYAQEVCKQVVLDLEHATLTKNEISVKSPVSIQIPVTGELGQISIGFDFVNSEGKTIGVEQSWGGVVNGNLEIKFGLTDYNASTIASYKISKARITLDGISWVQDLSKQNLFFNHPRTEKFSKGYRDEVQLNHWTVAPLEGTLNPGQSFHVSVNIEKKSDRINLMAPSSYTAKLISKTLFVADADDRYVRIGAATVEKSELYKNVYYLTFKLPSHMPSVTFGEVEGDFGDGQKILLTAVNHFETNQENYFKLVSEKRYAERAALSSALFLNQFRVRGNVSVQQFKKIGFESKDVSAGEEVVLSATTASIESNDDIKHVAVELTGKTCRVSTTLWAEFSPDDQRIKFNIPTTLPQDQYCISHVWTNHAPMGELTFQNIVDPKVFANQCIGVHEK